MSESILFETQYSAPLVTITKASYGKFTKDMTKVIDVTCEIQSLCNNDNFSIGIE